MLKPQEKIIAKPGSMCYMSGSIQMENVYATENEAGVWQWLFGKNTTSIVFHNTGTTDGFVGIAAPSLARNPPVRSHQAIISSSLIEDLAKFGGEILCQPDAFLCSINDVKVSNTIDQRPRNLVASAEIEPLTDMIVTFPGILKAEDIGPRACLCSRELDLKKSFPRWVRFAVDVPSIVALSSTVNVQVKYNGPMRRVVFGNDNLVTAVLLEGLIFEPLFPFSQNSVGVHRDL
ncbi:hypothetical protein HAX54_036371 [Datura stramonium]|uniref:Altered inheritance of mitochondria protein 24, mitochondrial n=1 Tax=Datura stramonium TaxID=4076 RepID=A0ABS8VI16_DATST|nr:hypothetical protein [Datura stramonium]